MKKNLKTLKKDLALMQLNLLRLCLQEVAIIGGQRAKAEIKQSLEELEKNIKDI